MAGKRAKSIQKLRKIFSKQRQCVAPDNATSLSGSGPDSSLEDASLATTTKKSSLKTCTAGLRGRLVRARSDARQEERCRRSSSAQDHRCGNQNEHVKKDAKVSYSSEPDIDGQVYPVETPMLVARKLRAFDAAVAKLEDCNKNGVKEAMIKCPDLLDRSFKLQFLRCDVFDEALAAKRYAKYWDMRIHLFGPERAFLPLTPKEALKIDPRAILKDDCSLVLAMTLSKDSFERNSFEGNPDLQQIASYPLESMVRAVWCIFHAALEDDAPLADLRLSLFGSQVIRDVAPSLQGCIPLRGISGIHRCIPPMISYSPSQPTVGGGTKPQRRKHPFWFLGEWAETAEQIFWYAESCHLC